MEAAARAGAMGAGRARGRRGRPRAGAARFVPMRRAATELTELAIQLDVDAFEVIAEAEVGHDRQPGPPRPEIAAGAPEPHRRDGG
jgi:hypothetical protein